METVDTILTNGIVVTMNEQFDLLPDGAVAIRGRDIVAVGESADIEARYTTRERVDCHGAYILPGLVNAHTHAAMTLLRGLADDLRLDVWLLAYVMPVERQFVTPEFCRLGTTLACAEMIRSGITSFADMYYFEEEVAVATETAGLRGVLGQTVLQFPSPDADTYEDGLARAEAFIRAWRGNGLITPAVAPHAPYTNPDETMRRCRDLALKYDVPLLTHLAETRLEVDDSLEKHETTVVQHMHALDLFEANVLAAHCVHIDLSEIRLLHGSGAGVAHCPSSNLKLASGVAPVPQMLEQGMHIGVGTDGPASNNDLDMFEEMRLAAFVAKISANDPTALPARQALLMATRQGAEALFMGDRTGSLEAGKRADVIVLDGRALHSMPHFERNSDLVYSQIVYAGHAADVRDVYCNGRALMRDRALLTIDEQAILDQAQAYAIQVDAFMREREASLLNRLVAVSELERTESFEVQVKSRLESDAAVHRLLASPEIEVEKQVHYRQYDTYFLFDDPAEGRVRYREDDLIDEDGQVQSVRSRLTLTMPTKERAFRDRIQLSRSRFITEANRPLRFYREYFRPVRERELQKDRYRWHIRFRGELFYLNLDRLEKPALDGLFVEIKSRTWSAIDAQNKAELIRELMEIAGIPVEAAIPNDYLELEPATP